ncbi:MAG: hypothetical protein WC867_07155 [Candidatus Pacearchaeota archaeon]|jgi:hypothetical protein
MIIENRIRKDKKKCKFFFKSKYINIIFIILVILTNNILITATIIGISPASVGMTKVLRGGYAERNIVVSTDSVEPILIKLTQRGDTNGWINYSDDNFSISKDSPYVLKMIILPPLDQSNGNYSGFLTFSSSPFGKGREGQAVGVIRSTLDLALDFEIIDTEIMDCSAKNFIVESAEKGDDIIFNLVVINNGNIRFKPNLNIKIWDIDQIEIKKEENILGQEILPTTADNYSARVKSDELEVGQYFAEISIDECYSSQLLTFDILTPGALKADGSLLGIILSRQGYVGERVPIRVSFKNTGQKDVSAQFDGKIVLDGKTIQKLDSQKIGVSISQTKDFNFEFQPEKPGKYIISGKVYYSGKKTFESSASIDIIDKTSKKSNLFIYLIYLALIFFIVVLFYKINKERRIYNHNLKRLRR